MKTKHILAAWCAYNLALCNPSNAKTPAADNQSSAKLNIEKTTVKNLPNMTGVPWTTNVSIGKHAKFIVRPSERSRVQRFYRNVLGCRVIVKPKVDLIQMGAGFYIGVQYDDQALEERHLMKSAWLELRTDLPDELRHKILDFGVKEIEYWDKDHFYFQAPGGQVFRLVGHTEDMSAWER